MKTIESIRKDLKEIRYYSMYQKDINQALLICPRHEVVEKIKYYNRVIEFAPLQLYHIYFKLYIEGHTQESLAKYLQVTPEYVYKLHMRLLHFFNAIFSFENKYNEAKAYQNSKMEEMRKALAESN